MHGLLHLEVHVSLYLLSPKRRYELYRLYKSYKRTLGLEFSYHKEINT